MAAVLKATRIEANPFAGFGIFGGKVTVYFVNPGTSPPTPGSVTFSMDPAEMESSVNIQDAADEAILLVGSNSFDWDL